MKNFILFTFLITLAFPHYTNAQETQDISDFMAGSDIDFTTDEATKDAKTKDNGEAKAKIDKNTEITVIEDKHAGEYSTATVKNLSKLYWKMKKLSIKDDEAIDNFMLINECDIYQKFYKDDFEWLRVREAGRDMLKENKDSFSKKFQIIVPVDLGRYDMQRKGFPLENKSAFKDLRRIEIGGNNNNAPICKTKGNITGYPKNLILILNKPFSFNFVELDEHIAQAFIIRRKYNPVKINEEMRMSGFQRPAFARIRFTLSKYQGEAVDSNHATLSIMFGKLNGVDIFEDSDEKVLLTSVDYD